jgi:hypothetical protein
MLILKGRRGLVAVIWGRLKRGSRRLNWRHSRIIARIFDRMGWYWNSSDRSLYSNRRFRGSSGGRL